MIVSINKTKSVIFGISAILSVLTLSACSSSDKPGESKPAASIPAQVSDVKLDAAELVILSIVPSITQDEFVRTMEAPIKAKYPQHKLTYIIQGGNNTMEKMVLAGNPPDILITSLSGMYSSMVAFNMQYDLAPLVKKYNYDMTRIEPTTIESLTNATGGGLYGLPKYTNGIVTFYNKDLFSKFGVAVPKDGMTWEETTSLAKTMTRNADGIQYRGMGMFFSNMVIENQLSLPLMAAKENKATVNVPGFQKLFQAFKGIYDIPGNKPDGAPNADKELTAFQKDRNIAMVAAPMSGYGRFETDKDLNWDMVSAPSFSDVKGVGYQPNTIYYFISNANKKAEQAFQVVTQLLTDDLQLQANKEGRPTILKNDKIRATLGEEHPVFKNKNFKALFVNKFAPTPPWNPTLAPLVNANSILSAEFATMIKDGTDVNTMLRQADEKINAAITTAAAK